MLDHAHQVDDIERDIDGAWWWIYTKAGWGCDGCHTIHESAADCVAALDRIEPCDCDDCRADATTKEDA